MSVQKGKLAAKEQGGQTYIQVERGIYRYKDKDGEITYHERPWIISRKGKPVRTYRALGRGFARQTNLACARTEYYWRRTEVEQGRNPYEEKEKPQAPAKDDKLTVEQIIREYVRKNYPDRFLRRRNGRTLEGERDKCEKLLEYCGPAQPWHGLSWDSLNPRRWDDYHEWRLEQINGPEAEKGVDDTDLEPKGPGDLAMKPVVGELEDPDADLEPEEPKGNRAVDLERNTLNNAFKYAVRMGKITSNPVPNFPRFHPPSAVRHCREFQPRTADEVHYLAGLLFAKRCTEALGWQLLFEAESALRTSEVLKLRMDADAFGQPGFIDNEDNLHVGRLKRGINPFVHCHAGLKEILKAHAIWHAVRFPDNPYFIPGKRPGRPATRRELARALYILRATIGRKITSHGMRAFYVLVRRSWGVQDGVIAVELGIGSGAELIATTYGDVPPNWRNGGGPKLSWQPTGEPAWASMQRNGWKTETPEGLAVAA